MSDMIIWVRTKLWISEVVDRDDYLVHDRFDFINRGHMQVLTLGCRRRCLLPILFCFRQGHVHQKPGHQSNGTIHIHWRSILPRRSRLSSWQSPHEYNTWHDAGTSRTTAYRLGSFRLGRFFFVEGSSAHDKVLERAEDLTRSQVVSFRCSDFRKHQQH